MFKIGVFGMAHLSLKTQPLLYGICGMSGSLARRHDEGAPVKGDPRKEPGVTWRGGTSWWDMSWQWLPVRNHPPPRYIFHKDGMELSHPQPGAPPGTDSIPSPGQSPVCSCRYAALSRES